MVILQNYSEGLRPSDSPTRSLAGPREPHSARVGSLARSFASGPFSVFEASSGCESRYCWKRLQVIDLALGTVFARTGFKTDSGWPRTGRPAARRRAVSRDCACRPEDAVGLFADRTRA